MTHLVDVDVPEMRGDGIVEVFGILQVSSSSNKSIVVSYKITQRPWAAQTTKHSWGNERVVSDVAPETAMTSWRTSSKCKCLHQLCCLHVTEKLIVT